MSIKIHPREILLLETEEGKIPFLEWLDSLKDISLERSVDVRLTRIQDGNFGDHKSVGKRVFEIRISKGPGLRIYYGLDEVNIVLLICGGDKSS